MKIVKLMGGLGNQMFQYAFGQLLGDQTRYDNTSFVDGNPRFYELPKWHVQPLLATEEEIAQQKNEKNIKSKLPGFVRKLMNIPKYQYTSDIRREKVENVYDASLLSGEGFFEGYFQCARYYDDIRPKLLKDFVPVDPVNAANQEMLNLIQKTNSVSLHVRRTDYLALPEIYEICDLAYYKKAIDYIADHVKDPHFFLFSDDIEWVKNNLKIDFPYTIVDINHGHDSFWDIWLMKHCQHNIIANSSFSWWGAWLNENPNKIVIVPKIWFSDGRPTEIVPDNWVKLTGEKTEREFKVSLLVKTFLRPMCLDNFLASVKMYQEKQKLIFNEIVVIDDSDDENQKENQKILQKYQNLKIVYKNYPFNSLGLSKGRNEGLKFITNDWFILCDDDFIFDVSCDLESVLNLAIQKQVDILGGHYRDIEASDSKTYIPHNWMGFIRENDEFDYCAIFNEFFPKFCYCDIVQNIYIAKKSVFEKVQYPEDMPLLEHNVFFLRAKQAGIRVATTSDLWVKHFHIRSNARYNNLRARQVVNPVKKPVLGYLYTADSIIHFHDYLHVGSDEIYTRRPMVKCEKRWGGLIEKKIQPNGKSKFYFLGIKVLSKGCKK